MEIKWSTKALADLVRLYNFLLPINKQSAALIVQSLTEAPTKLLAQPRIIMAGSKMTTMTLEEMRAARERGESQSDWKRVHRMVQDGIEPAEDEASPNAAALMRADLEKRRRGRPASTDGQGFVGLGTVAPY